MDARAGVTQEEGHTGFLIHLPSAALALIFLARRIQPVRFPRRPCISILGAFMFFLSFCRSCFDLFRCAGALFSSADRCSSDLVSCPAHDVQYRIGNRV